MFYSAKSLIVLFENRDEVGFVRCQNLRVGDEVTVLTAIDIEYDIRNNMVGENDLFVRVCG